MSNLPKLRTKYGEPIGVELFFSFPEVQENEKTFLDTDAASGVTSLSANGVNFSVGQYIVIGNPGQEKTEIIRIHASTVTTSTTITLASATSFAHNRGDVIRFIPYNQIEPSRSTDSGSNFSALTAINIRADATETYLQRSSDASTDVYKFRFYNSADALYSAYSSNVTASGFGDNTVYSVKKRALEGLGERIDETITTQFLIDALNEGRREVDQDPRVLRWSFRTKFNTDIGNIIPGQYSLTVPTDLRDANTHKNILSLRMGRSNRPCTYQDNRRFRQNYLNIAHTTLNGALVTSDTSIVLTSSGDFDESGTIYIAAAAVTGTNDAVAYTANAESTNTLSGVTGIIAAGHVTSKDVWQGATFGLPSAYTIDNGSFYWDVPFADSYAGENIWCDYYETLVAVANDSDTFDEPDYDLYVSWLRWKIKYKKSNGALKAENDSDYLEYRRRVDALVNREMTGQYVNFVPNTSGFLSDNG